jgi:ABC-type sugar transport system permease subunit
MTNYEQPSAVNDVRAPTLPARRGWELSERIGSRGVYWLFCLPALLVLVVVIGIPTGYTINLSLERYNLLEGGTRTYVGLANYTEAIRDTALWRAVGRTGIYIAVTGVFDFLLGFAQALLVYYVGGRLGKFLKGLFILPILLVPSAAAVFWALVMYGPPFEEFNRVLGISVAVPILGQTNTALLGILITVIWAWSPWTFVLLSSGLESLNREPIEAASVDGAGYWTTVRKVILPMMKPVIFVTVVFHAVASLNTFAFPWAMTQGGPANSSHVFATYIYQGAFTQFNYGYGAAESVIMLALGIGAAALAARLAARSGYA